MKQPTLFGEDEGAEDGVGTGGKPGAGRRERTGRARVRRPDREQFRMVTLDVDALVSPKHRVRAIWAFVAKADLGEFYGPIKARSDGPGRTPVDPRILLALWLYATSKGVGSAREVARLCQEHDAYRWICGGVAVNRRQLAEFRSNQGGGFRSLLVSLLAALRQAGVLKGKRVAQDGMRVRASAGAASFHRRESIERSLKEAKELVARAEQAKDNAHGSARKAAARARIAADQQKRAEEALKALDAIQRARRAGKDPKKAEEEVRASTTDPDARRMRMADGGYRPAYNVQLATDVDTRFIVGVHVTNSGSDMGQLVPMLDQLKSGPGLEPEQILVDGGFVNLAQITQAAVRGIEVYAPVPTPRNPEKDPHAPKAGDTKAVAEWRARMKTKRAKSIYKNRCATAETVNADLRQHRGLDTIPVRGLHRALSLCLLAALTYDVLRAMSLGVLA